MCMCIACARHADMCLCAMPPCAMPPCAMPPCAGAAARRVQAAAPCPMNVPRIPGAASRGYTYYASQARLAAEDAQPWYNSEAQKPQALRQGVGKYIAQSTWEQAHAPAPRWGGAAVAAAAAVAALAAAAARPRARLRRRRRWRESSPRPRRARGKRRALATSRAGDRLVRRVTAAKCRSPCIGIWVCGKVEGKTVDLELGCAS